MANAPTTNWRGTQGEYSSSGASNIADPSGNLLVDPAGYFITDTGELFTLEPATGWGTGTETAEMAVWRGNDGEFTTVSSSNFATNDGKLIVTNDGKQLVTNTQQFTATPVTVWTSDDGNA
jgi:hypothetical protein